MKIIIVSGMSGSGKSTVLKALEDAGYFCVDNFPILMLQKFLEASGIKGPKIDRCAFVVDIRMKEFFSEGQEVLMIIKEKYHTEFLFLESSDGVLLRRYKETRRSHPLFDQNSIKEAISKERTLIRWIRNIADRVIDTSNMTPHDLRRYILEEYGEETPGMKINIMSFGFAHGIPMESDMTFDVRFLPNPFFVEQLKDKTGLTGEVGAYIASNSIYKDFFARLVDLLVFLIPLFEKEGKSYLTIGIGCTGGKHRSVFVASQVSEELKKLNYKMNVTHRDIEL